MPFWRKYIFSSGHRVVGVQYFFLALVAVLVGVTLSILMRIHLIHPAGMTPEMYLTLMTMHGTIMVFFVLTTAPQGAFGNALLPLQLGAREMAYPWVTGLSFWTTLAAFFTLIAAFFVQGGAPLSGWTAYPPLSALGARTGPGEGLGQSLWVVSIGIFCIASILGAINFIATVLQKRCAGMTLMRMPLTAWAWFVTAILSLLAFSVLLAAGVLLLLDRHAGTSFFIPGGLIVSGVPVTGHNGGSPILWQHLFWFFGHPEVYIAILPGMGAVSHILSTMSRKPIFGYRAMVYSTLAIGFLGFLVWGHHMFTSGMSPYASMAFALMTGVIAVPSAVKTFNWIGTLWNGRIQLNVAMLFALGFVSVFVTGGLSGIILAQPILDAYFHDTYFVVAHFHMIMGVASIFGIFAATYFWFPALFGTMLNETVGKVHFWLTFVGSYTIFIPMHFLGVAGHPRRYSETTGVEYLKSLDGIHMLISHAAFTTAAVQLLFLFNLFYALWKRRAAPENPWNCTSLEWTRDPAPVVNHGPYEYSLPGASLDFVMQNARAAEALFAAVGDPPPQSSGVAVSANVVPAVGVALTASAITMVFIAFTSALIVRRGVSFDWTPTPFPPALWLNTAVLLLSSVTASIASRGPRINSAERARIWLWITAGLGFAFLGGQSYAWTRLLSRGVSLSSNPSAAFLFVLTGAHAVFALSGVLALLTCAFRQRLAVAGPALYWHFINALWIYLLIVLLYWR